MNLQTQLEEITEEIKALRKDISELEKKIEALDHNFTQSYGEIKSKAEIEADKTNISPIKFTEKANINIDNINQQNLHKILKELLKI